jgi:hypothetical protein
MVAERDDQKVIKERASALILLANARVWESEGWQVMITDAEGKEFDPAGFEKLLGPGYTWSPPEPLSSWPQYQATALQPQEAEEASAEKTGQASDAALEAETETLEAGSFDELESTEKTEHDEELEPLEETDEYDEFEPFDEAEEFEDELEPHH